MIKIKLKPQEIKLIKENFEHFTFTNDFHLVYQNQVPNMSVLLIEGEIELLKRKKKIGKLEPGTLIGLVELLLNKTVAYDCKVKQDSICILISKSTLLSMNKKNNKPALNLISQILKNYEKKCEIPHRRLQSG